ncbi:hypothetical protein GCM10007242_30220 [Pigmentiphaga litoralis]|uniref:glutathione peroxidase n=1 Tax=Pigmentiphaga litoralis TaxID=516702 RepID=UPI00167864C1|nr:glutathione peroxidase [Pigmentiphaga litoralis]GGX21013.1 hypothetical protein GCM10007242_30220 [Pigmentiphaga litoralis]
MTHPARPTHALRIDPRRLRTAWMMTALVAASLLAFQAMAAESGTPGAARPMATADKAAACPGSLNVDMHKLQDESVQNLCQYAGKVLLVVNTASYCGYTRQYEGLEKLYGKYRNRGLVVLAFPSNDFGQEAADKSKIETLCFNTYGVKFPIFTPTPVTGNGANPLFRTLIKSTGQAPAWNFHKYLVDRNGQPVAAFPSNVEPEDPRLTREIERLLARPTT